MPRKQNRRQFLKSSAALAGLTVGALGSASGQVTQRTPLPDHLRAADRSAAELYGVRSRYAQSLRKQGRAAARGGGEGILTPLQDLDGVITPASLHFIVDHGAPWPDPDPREYRLLIHGMVDRPLIFTLDELKRLPSVTRQHFLMCAGNTGLSLPGRKNSRTVQDTHGFCGNCEWTGVPLSLLLKEAGVQRGASWIIAEGAEMRKLQSSFPLTKAWDDVLVAYAQNGEAVRPEHGYPVRLVVPGWEGIRNVKWLRRINVADGPGHMKYESTIYTNVRPDGTARWFQFELEPNSVITFPSGEQQLPVRGFYEIRGLAWTGSGAVRRVEVSTDGGRSWKDAQLQEPIHRMAHTRFRFPWDWDGQENLIMSRCTDEWGDVQPSRAELERIWGVNSKYWLTTENRIQHYNAIQPWRVSRDGSVHNAMWE